MRRIKRITGLGWQREKRHARALLGLASSAAFLLALTGTAAAGEISDSNQRIEKFIVQVNDEPERDPELSVGGEVVQIYEGGTVDFLISIIADPASANEPALTGGVVTIEDRYPAELSFRSAVFLDVDAGRSCVDDPDANDVECAFTLDADGNGRVRIKFDVEDRQSEGNVCTPIGNNIATIIAAATTEGEPVDLQGGSDPVQMLLCPAAAPAPTPTPTPRPTDSREAVTPPPTATVDRPASTSQPIRLVLAVLMGLSALGLVAAGRRARP